RGPPTTQNHLVGRSDTANRTAGIKYQWPAKPADCPTRRRRNQLDSGAPAEKSLGRSCAGLLCGWDDRGAHYRAGQDRRSASALTPDSEQIRTDQEAAA